jgi:hypothetical protein
MSLPKQNLNRKKEKQSIRGCLMLFSTIFNISYLPTEGSGFLKDKMKTEE